MLTARQLTQDNPSEFKPVEHIILVNMWEYYVIDTEDGTGQMFGYVMGEFPELGYFNISEIKPYILTRAKLETTDTDSDQYIAPPMGYEWVA